MKEQYDFQKLTGIIARLRAEDGCPWDRKQTHESLAASLVDEAAEVLSAVDMLRTFGDGANLCEELGDLLMVIMLHSQIAAEEGLFTIDDVVEGICEKMIRRHPHVFGRDLQEKPQVENVSQVLASWEEIKRQEKKDRQGPALPSKREIMQRLVTEGEKRLHEIG